MILSTSTPQAQAVSWDTYVLAEISPQMTMRSEKLSRMIPAADGEKTQKIFQKYFQKCFQL